MHLPRGVAQIGRWGEGVSSADARGSADPGEAIGGTSWILLSIARSPACRVSGPVYRLSGAVISRSSDLESPSHRPRNRSLADRIPGHPWPARSKLLSFPPARFLDSTADRALRREDKMTVKIIPNDKGNPPGKLADVELHFTSGPLEG